LNSVEKLLDLTMSFSSLLGKLKNNQNPSQRFFNGLQKVTNYNLEELQNKTILRSFSLLRSIPIIIFKVLCKLERILPQLSCT
jgi:hypothetical protein